MEELKILLEVMLLITTLTKIYEDNKNINYYYLYINNLPWKISIPNGTIIIISFFQNLFSPFIEKFNNNIILYIFMSTIALASLLLLIKKKPVFNLIAVAFQYTWLIFMFKINYLKYWYYTVPTLIYIILSIILIYKLFSKKQLIK